MKDFSNYKLTDNVTVGQLQSWMADKSDSSKGHIIELIEHRFENRYLKHVKSIDSGFLMMAVSCLLIETILENPPVLTPSRHTYLNVKMNGERGLTLPVFPNNKHSPQIKYLRVMPF